jgi:hypothetical protein
MRTAVLMLLGLSACATSPAHGTWSDRTLAIAKDGVLCSHRVPEASCVLHHPELASEFRRTGDRCGEHAVPESQCLVCHPDLTFEPLPALASTADVRWLTTEGAVVGPLSSLSVAGKVTVVDFYADWCAPCRKVDRHLFTLSNTRTDLAVRKLNVVSWETPLAKEHLREVPTLPFLVVFGRDGREVKRVSGFDLAALDAALVEASR